MGWKVVSSSTDGGKKAYNEILEILRSKNAVFAITPDGPQGPAKIPKPGAIRAAQRTGAIIVPVAGQSSKRWEKTLQIGIHFILLSLLALSH